MRGAAPGGRPQRATAAPREDWSAAYANVIDDARDLGRTEEGAKRTRHDIQGWGRSATKRTIASTRPLGGASALAETTASLNY